MNALNQIILEGNVIRQPEKKLSPAGTSICTIPVAVNRKYKTSDGQTAEEVSYFDVDTFGNLADACAKWCPKGRGLRIVGRLKQNRWKDKEGKAHSMVRIIADHVDFKKLSKKEAVAEGPKAEFAAEVPLVTKQQKRAMLSEAAQAARTEEYAVAF